MKTILPLLLLLLTNSIFGQMMYVTADNGLIVRESPDRNAARTGKLEYGARVVIEQETEIELTIKDGEETIVGSWVAVYEPLGNQSGYVFNGYLTEAPISPKIEIKFEDFSLQMNLDASIDNEFGEIHKDSAALFLELGETIEKKKVKIIPSKFKKIEVFQRYENSITIMDEGAHCDLTNWKHYYSEWKKLAYNSSESTFITDSYTREEYAKFLSLDMNEFKSAVDKECDERYSALIKNIQAVNEYPSGVSMSNIFIKIVLTDENDSVTEKIISVEIPMGC